MQIIASIASNNSWGAYAVCPDSGAASGAVSLNVCSLAAHDGGALERVVWWNGHELVFHLLALVAVRQPSRLFIAAIVMMVDKLLSKEAAEFLLRSFLLAVNFL